MRMPKRHYLCWADGDAIELGFNMAATGKESDCQSVTQDSGWIKLTFDR